MGIVLHDDGDVRARDLVKQGPCRCGDGSGNLGEFSQNYFTCTCAVTIIGGADRDVNLINLSPIDLTLKHIFRIRVETPTP